MASNRPEVYFYIKTKKKQKDTIASVLNVQLLPESSVPIVNEMQAPLRLSSIKKIDEVQDWAEKSIDRLARKGRFYKWDGEHVSALQLERNARQEWDIKSKADEAPINSDIFFEKNAQCDFTALHVRWKIVSQNGENVSLDEATPNQKQKASNSVDLLKSFEKIYQDFGLSTPEAYADSTYRPMEDLIRSFEKALEDCKPGSPKALVDLKNDPTLRSIEKLFKSLQLKTPKPIKSSRSVESFHKEMDALFAMYTLSKLNKQSEEVFIEEETEEDKQLFASLDKTNVALDKRFEAVDGDEEGIDSLEKTIAPLKSPTPQQQNEFNTIISTLKMMNVKVQIRKGFYGVYAFLGIKDLARDCKVQYAGFKSRLPELGINVREYNGANSWEKLSLIQQRPRGNAENGVKARTDSESSYDFYADGNGVEHPTSMPQTSYDVGDNNTLFRSSVDKHVKFKDLSAHATPNIEREGDTHLQKPADLSHTRHETAPYYDTYAPVSSHFLLLSAFQQLPANKQGAMIYMLGFAMLAIATGGASVIGAGMAVGLGYAGASMMITGTAIMFFNEPIQASRAKQPEQWTSCCL